MKHSTQKMTMAGLFAALCCVMTMVIQIPSPTGYVNLGDCMVLLGAVALGPVYGTAAGAVGSALADILLGWAAFAPGTFVIKGGSALIAALLFGLIRHPNSKVGVLMQIVFFVLAELWMAVGYFVYESLILGYGMAAVESIPGNLMQGLVGVVLAVILHRLMAKTPLFNKESKV
ncbi:MAG: ECF transporter S component [Ruminococcaceae bacterium]|nr:ECF transporter S component [Oscillospiraceae bacterium]